MRTVLRFKMQRYLTKKACTFGAAVFAAYSKTAHSRSTFCNIQYCVWTLCTIDGASLESRLHRAGSWLLCTEPESVLESPDACYPPSWVDVPLDKVGAAGLLTSITVRASFFCRWWWQKQKTQPAKVSGTETRVARAESSVPVLWCQHALYGTIARWSEGSLAQLKRG